MFRFSLTVTVTKNKIIVRFRCLRRNFRFQSIRSLFKDKHRIEREEAEPTRFFLVPLAELILLFDVQVCTP